MLGLKFTIGRLKSGCWVDSTGAGAARDSIR